MRSNHKPIFFTIMLMSCWALAVLPVFAQAPPNLPGTIAYFRVVGATETDPGTSELHLIDPSGNNDRVIYSTPRGLTSIYPVAGWRPDGQEIAFISGHEFSCSRFDSDIFAVQPNGAGLRRITNSPACTPLQQLPKGAVTVTVQNVVLNESDFFVYVEGATELKQVIVSPGFSATVTVENVADLNKQQVIYVKSGAGTWFNPAAYAEVVPGQTVQATDAVRISNGFGPYQLRVNTFSWKGDGSALAYIVEAGLRDYLPANPTNGQLGAPVFAGNQSAVSTSLSWSPTSDEFLYYSILAFPNGIYRGTLGSDVSTHTLVIETDYVDNIDWLDDGSGFVFSINKFGFFVNLLGRFDLNTNQAYLLLEDFNIVGIVASPDGNYYTFARRESDSAPFDLWGMTHDGSQSWKITENIVSWDWGPQVSTGVREREGAYGAVDGFQLLPCYPNPFNPSTKISYVLPSAAHVTIKVFDLAGREVAKLVDENKPAGAHAVTFEAQREQRPIAGGVYVYEMTAARGAEVLFRRTEKMAVVK